MTLKNLKTAFSEEREQVSHLQEGLLVQGIQLGPAVLEGPGNRKQGGNLRRCLPDTP